MNELKTNKDIIIAQTQYVAKSNILIQRCKYDLSLMEQKVLLYIISKIKLNDSPNTEYLFDIKDFCATCNLYKNSREYIDYLKSVMFKLGSHVLQIDIGENKTLLTHWFSSIILNLGNNTFSVLFDRNISPYLFNLRKLYTQYTLEYILAMKSKYGIRLYELLKSTKLRTQVYEIDKLKELIGCNKYDLYKEFNRNVIQPALEDINLYSDLIVNVTQRKTGKKVSSICFTLIPLTPKDMILKYESRRKVLDE